RVRRARNRSGKRPLEGAGRRPGQTDAVLVVGANPPVEDRVGRIRGVARVRGRVGGQVVDGVAEARILRDLEPVAPRSFGRRPTEIGLSEELRAVCGSNSAW